MKHFFQSLPGYFDFWDLYLDECARVPDGGSVTEVGVWCGRSLAFLAVEFANRAKKVTLYGVDLFTQTAEMATPANKESLLRTLGAHGVEATLVQALSWEAADQFDNESQDFVFIDAAHDYDSVSRDLAAWWPRVKRGGTFAGHDATQWHPDVVRAVREFSARVGVHTRVQGSCWVMSKGLDTPAAGSNIGA